MLVVNNDFLEVQSLDILRGRYAVSVQRISITKEAVNFHSFLTGIANLFFLYNTNISHLATLS